MGKAKNIEYFEKGMYVAVKKLKDYNLCLYRNKVGYVGYIEHFKDGYLHDGYIVARNTWPFDEHPEYAFISRYLRVKAPQKTLERVWVKFLAQVETGD